MDLVHFIKRNLATNVKRRFLNFICYHLNIWDPCHTLEHWIKFLTVSIFLYIFLPSTYQYIDMCLAKIYKKYVKKKEKKRQTEFKKTALEELILTGVGIIHFEEEVPASAVDVETLLSNPHEFIDVKYVNLTPLCKKSEDVFCEFTECLTDKPNAVNLEVLHILLKPNKHIKLYHMLFSMCEITEKEIKTTLDFDVIEASSSLTSTFSSPVV